MSIQAISSSVSVSSAAAPQAAGGVDAAGGVADSGQVLGSSGVMAQQMSSLMSLVGDSNQTNALATLALALLLSKSDESKEKQDPWKMLASMALMSGLMQGQQIQMSTQITIGGASGAAAYDASSSSAGAGAAASFSAQA